MNHREKLLWQSRKGAQPPSNAYTLASEDMEFLNMEDLRPLRLQLELLKPEWYLRQEGIHSTIVVFGSARIPPPEVARTSLAELERAVGKNPDESQLRTELRRARKRQAYSHYYEEARKFSSLVSRKLEDAGLHDFIVVTGGGPGIMEAANRGAQDANSRSVGLNISLPHEQEPNPYVSHELCFQFRYFAIRKMHFLLRAKALVAFPGGYGTLDEVFEVLTLIQTGKIAPIPVVLVGRDYWAKAVNFDFLVEEEFIDADDITSFEIVDRAEEAIGVIQGFYGGKPPQ